MRLIQSIPQSYRGDKILVVYQTDSSYGIEVRSIPIDNSWHQRRGISKNDFVLNIEGVNEQFIDQIRNFIRKGDSELDSRKVKEGVEWFLDSREAQDNLRMSVLSGLAETIVNYSSRRAI